MSLKYDVGYNLRSSEKPLFQISQARRKEIRKKFFNRCCKFANELDSNNDIKVFEELDSLK